MALVEAARFSSAIQASLARLLLETRGIEAEIFDEGLNYSFGGGMPVRLMVLDEDAAEAARLLADDGLL